MVSGLNQWINGWSDKINELMTDGYNHDELMRVGLTRWFNGLMVDG